jgi:hypothetical protein
MRAHIVCGYELHRIVFCDATEVVAAITGIRRGQGKRGEERGERKEGRGKRGEERGERKEGRG